MTLDEKNHVMNTAHDALEKQLKRCQSSFPYIEDEISEEARLGSMTHWAYNSEKPTEKKGMMAGERTRRAANHAAAVETDISAMRSEPRREAVPSRKSRLQNLVDSDFDETRTYAGKKTQNGNKSRKVPDGLGISNVPVVNNKRRKVEQPPSGGFPMGRSMSSVYASGARGSSPAIDSKKKARGAGAVTASNGKRRYVLSLGDLVHSADTAYRANGNTTGLNSPSASSPVIGTFPPSKDHNGRSPALSTAQRNTSSRTQQNLTHPRPTQLSRNRSSSTTNSHRRASAANGNGITDNHTTLPNHSSTSLDKLSTLTGKSTGDVRTTMRESLNAKGERMVEDNSIGNDGSTDMRGALVIGSAEQPKENGTTPHPSNTTATSRTTRPDRPPSISLSTRGNGHNTTANTTSTKSKTATPVTATFSSAESKQDHQRPSRPPRGRVDLPAKRSHKKGAGIQAQLAAAAAAAAKGGTKGGGGEATADEVDDDKMDGVELGAEEERGEGEGSGEGGEEPRYCYCGDVSYGEMVGCDADDCSREWFHLSCVGLSRAPAKTGESLPFFLAASPFLFISPSSQSEGLV